MPDEAREVFVYSDDFKFPTEANFRPTVMPADAPDFTQDAPSLEGTLPQDESELPDGDQGTVEEGKAQAPVEKSPVEKNPVELDLLGSSPDLAGTARTGTKPPVNS